MLANACLEQLYLQLRNSCGTCSMDNETFMNYTCGDTPAVPSQEYTQEDEGEGEGFVEPTPKRGRGTNFSQKEDETLCNAWRKIGVDAIVGNEQQSSAYWNRIHELYKLLLNGDMPRSAGSLQNRFHTINADCFKWSCCLAQVDRLNPSGTNAEDKVAQNCAMHFILPFHLCCFAQVDALLVSFVAQHCSKFIHGKT